MVIGTTHKTVVCLFLLCWLFKPNNWPLFSRMPMRIGWELIRLEILQNLMHTTTMKIWHLKSVYLCFVNFPFPESYSSRAVWILQTNFKCDVFQFLNINLYNLVHETNVWSMKKNEKCHSEKSVMWNKHVMYEEGGKKEEGIFQINLLKLNLPNIY